MRIEVGRSYNWDNDKLCAQLRVEGGLATGTTRILRSQLRVKGGLATGMKQNYDTICESRVDLQPGNNKQKPSCELSVDVQLG